MSPLDPNLPVIVGVGEFVRRPGHSDPSEATEPAALMAASIRAALADAGEGVAGALLEAIATIAVAPSAAWTDGDPGRRVGELLGVTKPTMSTSMQGGNGPQLLVNTLAARIQAGELGAAVVCGAESLSTLGKSYKTGVAPSWPPADGERRADEVLEEDAPAATDAENAAGMIAPVMAYPLIENAIRVAAGRTPDEQQQLIARVWSRFSEVATTQPAAWTDTAYTPEYIATPSPGNRLVTLPYTKLMNANLQVDQGAAVILTSVGVAQQLGIDPSRWVFVHAGAQATDEWFVSHRRELHRSPAIRACGQAAFAHAGITAGDLGPVDIYSCFPAAVELATTELGLPLDDADRPLTSTGGLTFFGGPGNNYATHGIIAVARRLREAPAGTVGLSTALGWYATKHALGIYGNAAPAKPFASLSPTPDALAPREVIEPAEATATAETCTLIYDRDENPSFGILFALLPDGRRAVVKTTDPETMSRMADADFLGSPVQLHSDRSFELAGATR